MFFDLFSKKQPAFGLDISGTSLKLMQLEHSGKGSAIKGFAYTPLPKGVLVNDAISDANTLHYLLQQSLAKPSFGAINTNYAVVSLPESKSFVRVIQIPKMGESEIDSAVPFEAEAYIPLPIDQVYLDWQKLGETGDKLNILIVAMPRDFVDKYISVLEGVNVETVCLEVESQSCQRALFAAGVAETSLVVDLDAYRSSLIMVEDGGLQFTSSVPIAGDMFTESIARALGVSSAKAETIKRKVGIANTPEYPNIKNAIIPVLNNLSAEIKNILKFHHDHSEKQVSRVLLCGGGARLKNLVEMIRPDFADTPGLKIELGNAWTNLPNLAQGPLPAEDALSFTTAIGLAMRGADFEIN